MKKCRQYVLALMMAAAVLSMTACGSMGDDGNSSAAGQNTTGAADGTLNGTTGGTINGTTGAGMNVGEDKKNAGEVMKDKTTGVIDGMMDDVKQGVDDLMGEGTTSASTTAATGK